MKNFADSQQKLRRTFYKQSIPRFDAFKILSGDLTLTNIRRKKSENDFAI